MGMTEVERKIFDAWALESPSLKVETHLGYIRERMKHTAFHEAGHAVANAFLGVYGQSNFEALSIIPTGDHLGHITISRVMPFVRLGGKFARYDDVGGKKEIIFHLAGRTSESRVNDDMLTLIAAIEWGFDEVDMAEEEWRHSVDEGKALTVAELLSNKVWTTGRILSLMEKWTNELLDIPEVWAVVEELAQRLIKDGQIFEEEFWEITEPMEFKWVEHPIWKRRFDIGSQKINVGAQDSRTRRKPGTLPGFLGIINEGL